MSVDPVLAQNAWEHVQIFFSGSVFLGIVAHAVQTVPTPKSPFWQWVLGIAQFAVGQRYRAANTIAGEGTLTQPVNKDTTNPPPKIDNPPLKMPGDK